MQRAERLALGTLLTVTLVGHGIRLIALGPADAPGSFTLLAGPGPADVAQHRARSARAGRPVGVGETIDVNSASAADLARIPGLGPRLAQTIVRRRAETQGFLAVADLDQIEGIGPRLLASLAPRIRFGDTSRVRARRGPVEQAPANQVQSRFEPPPTARPPSVLIPGKRRRGGSGGDPNGALVHLNSATQKDLETLPGIGPTRARAILAYRQANGPFAAVTDLEKVPGFSHGLVTQLAPQVVIP